jgi:hypothetical protein
MDNLRGPLPRWIRPFTSGQGIFHESVPTSLTEEKSHLLVDVLFQFTGIHPLNLTHQSVYLLLLDITPRKAQYPIEIRINPNIHYVF